MSTQPSFTTSDFPSIELDALAGVSGGAQTGVNVEVKGDVNKAIEQVGTGAGRLLGCATGADSMREFGNCILTGQLGNVPAAPGAPSGGSDASGW